MLKRFTWSLLISVFAVLLVIPSNLTLLRDAPLTPIEQSRLNFVGITIVEILLIFIVVFNVVNEYFTLHPNYKSLIDAFRNKHPDISEKYLRDLDHDLDDSHNHTDKDDKKDG